MKIIKTQDSSDTLFSLQFNEHYHSTFGAINESKHIFIKQGLYHSELKTIHIFEVGFGTGLNAFLSFLESLNNNLNIRYTCIEKFPIELETAKKLNYANILSNNQQSNFLKLHSCNWNEEIAISKNFHFKKIQEDFCNYQFTNSYDVIYFDAFAPETQPELWSTDIFRKIYAALHDSGILTTYSSKGIVKRNLREAGFIVERLKGPEGKRHILRAKKHF